ncbi:MAG: hypothetical protein Kow0037_25860 [Calditrichia bacterium]
MFKKLMILLSVILVPMLAFGGTTGKIAGVVVDKSTGEPLPGVNVIIEGTTLGASTDIDGYYVILNVPVGTFNVRASYIGFNDVVMQGVRVSVDLTTEVNFSLEPTTLELGEAIVVSAERPMVRKDETNTNIIKTSKEIQVMPIRGMQDIAGTVAGVVKQDNSNTMNIRGGRGNESAVYVDGVMVNDPYNYAVRAYIPNEAIEEISVQTGGFNAEYGEAMSGIVMLTTNSGAEHYFGSIQAVTDGFLQDDEKMLGTYSYGYNEYTVALGGPIIPGTRHTFFFSGSRIWEKDNTPSWGWAENPNKPEQFKGGPIPGNISSDWAGTAKVRFQLAKTMELKSSFVFSNRTFSGIDPIWVFNPQHAPEWSTEHRSFNATFTHTPLPTTYYDLKFNYFQSYRELYDPFFEDDLFKYGDPRYNPWPDQDQYFGEAYTKRLEPDFFAPGAQYDDFFKNKTTYWGIDFDVTHQYGKFHTFKAGFEYKYHTMREYRVLSPTQLARKTQLTTLERWRLADVRFYGYDLEGNEVDDGDYLTDVKRDATGKPVSGFDKQKPYNPIVMSAYIQDKIEFADLILNVGLRYDRIDPNAWQFKELEVRKDAQGNPIPGSGMFGGDLTFNKQDVVESEVHQFISPRLGISFPVSENTVFHAQYGKFYQPPSLGDLYLSPFYLDAFVNRGGYFTVIDNPNLKPEKTTSYEIGFKQKMGGFASLQLTAFYKETEDLVQVLNINTDVTNIAFTTNGDFGVVKGFDVIFNMRRYKNLTANFSYEYQIATGTGSASNTNFDIAWLGGARGNFPKFTMPLEFEQRHTGTINLDYRLGKEKGPEFMGIRWFENSGVNLLFSFNSGRPFTRTLIQNTQPHDGRYDNDISNIPVSAVNAERTPWVYRFDLKVDRTIDLPFMETSLNVYLWVINLLNTENIMDVWTTTGLPDQTGYLQTTSGKAYYEGLNDAERKQLSIREMDWNNYGMPRQIRLGVRFDF